MKIIKISAFSFLFSLSWLTQSSAFSQEAAVTDINNDHENNMPTEGTLDNRELKTVITKESQENTVVGEDNENKEEKVEIPRGRKLGYSYSGKKGGYFRPKPKPVVVKPKPVVVKPVVVKPKPIFKPKQTKAPIKFVSVPKVKVVVPKPIVKPTITEGVVETADLSILEEAVVAAGLADTLDGPGPFTVFAPVNSAFEDLDEETLNELLADPMGDLKDILKYHVVPGFFPAAKLRKSVFVKTLNGQSIFIKRTKKGMILLDDGTKIDANVIQADLKFKNGIVHLIDKVLIPPECPYKNPYLCQFFGFFY